MPAHTPDVFLGRQPILDRDRHVIAHELLFRPAPNADEAHVIDDALATRQVIDRAFGELGIHTVVGKARAFVNLCGESLMSPMVETLPREQVVLEILETVDIDERTVRRCRKLKAKGYRLALDDVSHYSEACEQLLDIVDIVKIDVLLVEPGALGELVRRLRLHDARLLAEKVECRERARECLELGFDLFQGFFFGRPVTLGA